MGEKQPPSRGGRESAEENGTHIRPTPPRPANPPRPTPKK